MQTLDYFKKINNKRNQNKKIYNNAFYFFFGLMFLYLSYLVINSFKASILLHASFTFLSFCSLAIVIYFDMKKYKGDQTAFHIEELEDNKAIVTIYEHSNSPSCEIRYFKNGVLHNDENRAIENGFFKTSVPENESYFLNGELLKVNNLKEFKKLVNIHKINEQF